MSAPQVNKSKIMELHASLMHIFGTFIVSWLVVFLLGIFRRVPCPSDTRGCPFTSQGAPCPLIYFFLIYW
jgi:hypothetical protein